MKQLKYDPVGQYALFEHEGEQRWLPDDDLFKGETPEGAWDMWTPATEVLRQRYLRRTRELMRDVRLTARAMALLAEFPMAAKLLAALPSSDVVE